MPRFAYLTRAVWLLSLISLFTDLASEMLYPVMPLYLQSIGFSVFFIGLLEGVAEAVAGLSKGYFGQWSDRLGRRVPFVQWGYGLSALSKPMLAVLATPAWVLLARTVDRLGKGLRTGARDALLSDEATPATKGKVFGFHRSMDTLGAVFGPLAALFWLAARPGQFRPLVLLAFVPGVLAVLCACYLMVRLRDTPQSVGLPPVEEYRHDYPPEGGRDREEELGTRELLVTYVLKNRALWLFAAANFFVYIARYSMLDWGPTYLKEVKRASLQDGGFSTAIFEFAGIFSTILMGWLSDKSGGRRGMISMLCMVPVFLAFGAILYTPPGMLWLDLTLFGVVGFFIYPPVMLLGVTGLDFSSKKAVGAAAGFIGLFGYLGRTVQGKALGTMAERYGWNSVFYAILISTVLAIVLLSFTWKLKPHPAGSPAQETRR